VRTVIPRVMAASASWLSLTDLGRIYGISAIHCGRTMEHLGWRDSRGRPTPIAVDMGAAMSSGPHSQGRGTLWNRDICGRELQARGYSPMSRSLQVQQWTQFLEAMEEGSPSIDATVEQMAEDIPGELAEDVNHQLAARGCRFRVSH
jgi:hypothetical protein